MIRCFSPPGEVWLGVVVELGIVAYVQLYCPVSAFVYAVSIVRTVRRTGAGGGEFRVTVNGYV